MTLIQIYRILWRWWWVIALLTFIVSAITFMWRVSQPPVYEATVTLAIGGFIQSPDPDLNDIRTGLDLVQTYAVLVRTHDVLQGTIDRLDLDLEVRQLARMMNTTVITGTSLLQISVSDNNPLEAQQIVNTLAEEVIAQSPSNLTEQQQQQVDLLNEQITSLSQELSDARERVKSLELALEDDEITQSERSTLTEERNFFLGQINEASASIGQFTNTIAGLQQRTNSVEIVERAEIPEETSGIGVFLTLLIAAFLTVSLTTSAVFYYEYLTDTLHDTEAIAQNLQLPVTGVISQFGRRDDAYSERLLTQLMPLSKTVQEFSTLRTNLIFSIPDDKQQAAVYVVSSASPREGKSVVSMNLAISCAMGGQRVLLIDADLRRPRVHTAFGLDNGNGLSTLLTKSPAENDNAQATLAQFIQPGRIPNLSILPAGFMPQNPAELLGFISLNQWLETLQKHEEYDLIFFDTPPILTVPDAAILAARTQARVLLVVQAGSTRRIEAQQAKQRFEQLKLEIGGVILNQVTRGRDSYYGYGYHDYYGNLPDTDNNTP